MKKKVIILAAAVVLLAAGGVTWFLHARGSGDESGDKEIKIPYEYILGGVELTALPVIDETVKVYQVKEKPTEAGESPDGEATTVTGEETVAKTEKAVTYRYEGLKDSGSLVGAYTVMMITADLGFSFVDAGMFRTDAPDFETESGVARIARQAAVEGKVMCVSLEWTPGSCLVTLDTPEAEVADPPAPEALTVAETLDYVRALPPAALGLTGASMEAYNVYAQDSIVLVDGAPCLRVNVYSNAGKAGTNEIAGNYLISANQNHIYLVDPETGALKEVGK